MNNLKDYTCNCQNNWIGKNCSVNHCLPINPCQHEGTCQTGLRDYTCKCKDEWIGTNCQFNVDSCHKKPCKNNGM